MYSIRALVSIKKLSGSTITSSIREEIGNRQGQRTDLLPQNFAEVKGKKTRGQFRKILRNLMAQQALPAWGAGSLPRSTRPTLANANHERRVHPRPAPGGDTTVESILRAQKWLSVGVLKGTFARDVPNHYQGEKRRFYRTDRPPGLSEVPPECPSDCTGATESGSIFFRLFGDVFSSRCDVFGGIVK